MTAKKPGLIVLRIVLLTVILTFVNGIGSRFLPATESAPPDQSSGWFLGLVFLILLLQTIALSYPVLRSRWSGWRLTATVALLYFGTVTFMSQVESLIYLGGKMPDGMLAGLFAMGLFNAVVFAPILVLVLGAWQQDEHRATAAPRTPSPWLGRALVAGGVYLALYYLFGYFVAWQDPVVRDYYGGADPESFLGHMLSVARDTPWMLAVQLARGLLWVALALLVRRMMRGGWWESGLATALLFSVPALYLLLPNPLMPEPVRMAHLLETAPYQFLFGFWVAWLFRPLGPTVPDTSSTASRR